MKQTPQRRRADRRIDRRNAVSSIGRVASELAEEFLQEQGVADYGEAMFHALDWIETYVRNEKRRFKEKRLIRARPTAVRDARLLADYEQAKRKERGGGQRFLQDTAAKLNVGKKRKSAKGREHEDPSEPEEIVKRTIRRERSRQKEKRVEKTRLERSKAKAAKGYSVS